MSNARNRDHLLLISHRSGHHAAVSGYTPIARYLPGRVITSDNPGLSYSVRRAISMFAQAPDYDSDSVTKETRAIRQMFGGSGIVHFMNGERDPFLTLPAARLTGWRTVATFHESVDRIRRTLRSRPYHRQLDGLIGVGENMVDFLSDIAGHDRVTYIPLGVDPDYFSPGAANDVEPLVLLVGQHMRDFEQFARVTAALHEKHPSLRFVTVTIEAAKANIPDVPWIDRRSRISDEELRDLYRSAVCLLLPLKDATANCAMVEALASGTPVVTTAIGGSPAYIQGESGVLCPPGDIDTMVDAVSTLFTDATLRARMSTAARARGLMYRWENVARQTADFYRDRLDVDLGALPRSPSSLQTSSVQSGV